MENLCLVEGDLAIGRDCAKFYAFYVRFIVGKNAHSVKINIFSTKNYFLITSTFEKHIFNLNPFS